MIFSLITVSCTDDDDSSNEIEKDCKCGIVYGTAVTTDGIGNVIYKIYANNSCSGNAKIFQVTQANYYEYYEGDKVCANESW